MDRNKNTWRILSVLAVVALLLGGLVLLDPQSNDLRQPMQGIGGGPNNEITIGEIVSDPTNYLNRSLTIRGEVDTVISPNVFVLDQELAIVGDEIIVINRDSLPEGADEARVNPLDNSDKVMVTGTVQIMTLTEVEREFDIDFDPEFEVEYDQRPILVADEVTRQTTE